MVTELFAVRVTPKQKKEIKELLVHIKERERYKFSDILVMALRMRKEFLKLTIHK